MDFRGHGSDGREVKLGLEVEAFGFGIEQRSVGFDDTDDLDVGAIPPRTAGTSAPPLMKPLMCP
jgi:hypothetical protein